MLTNLSKSVRQNVDGNYALKDLRRYGMQSFSHDIDESPNTGDEYTVEIGTATPKWVLPIMQVHKESNPALN